MFLKHVTDSERHEVSSNNLYTIVDKANQFISNDQANPVKYYRQALRDELKQPKMRSYTGNIVFEEYLPIVYKYYFKDCQHSVQQRKGTLSLALDYFVQVWTKLKRLERRDLNILVISCLLLASKLDEIDKNLPSFGYMIKHYSKSRYRALDVSKYTLQLKAYSSFWNKIRSLSVHQTWGVCAQNSKLEFGSADHI